MHKTEWISRANPWEPPQYDDDVIYAIRAFHSGSANEGQQKLVWRWFQYACGSDDISFRPDDKGGQRATDFAEGKRFMGQQLRKFLHPAMTPAPLNAPKQDQNTKPKKKRRK